MKRLVAFLILWFTVPSVNAVEPVGVSFKDVEITSGYWQLRQQINRDRTLLHLVQMCETEGRIRNLQRVAGQRSGGYEGNRGHDADLFKVMEAVCYSLATHPDRLLEAQLDRLIAIIACAQRKDGYLHTLAQLSAETARPDRLNLFAAGHLLSAGIAHYESTGKQTLLNVAIHLADLIDQQYGPNARVDVPSHSIMESALMRLAEVTGQNRYRNLALFFINERGYAERSGRRSYGLHNIDVTPLRSLQHAEGHVIGNFFVWLGMYDVGQWSNDRQLLMAVQRCFNDAVNRQMYLSGAMGRQSDERFSDPFALDNRTCIGEACQSALSIQLAQRLWTETLDARYADFIERIHYNLLSSNIGLDGISFFYHNRLIGRPEEMQGKPYNGVVKETNKTFQPRNCLTRQPWFRVPCCPPNASMAVATAGGHVYASSSEAIWINQYMPSRSMIKCGEADIVLHQKTRYPWKGTIQIRVMPQIQLWRGTIWLRIPEWTRCQQWSEGLYHSRNSGRWTVSLNGQPIDTRVSRKGYVALQYNWTPDDTIVLNLEMPVQRIESHPRVVVNQGRVALQRGPVIYCLEAVDHKGSLREFRLPTESVLHSEWDSDLLGGIMKIRCVRPEMTAVPYGLWANRQVGDMEVWIQEP